MILIEVIDAQAARLQAAGVSFGHGTTNAFDEAAWLCLWSLKLPLDNLQDNERLLVDAAQLSAIEILVSERIETRKPAAYLTREAWLQGVPFYVDERAIVPRSLVAELLAEGSFDAWLSDDLTRRALDLCTGNGSLAVLTAMTYPDVQVEAVDISADALAVAMINVANHAIPTMSIPYLSDLFSACTGEYDLIVCNPPYVNQTSMNALPAEYQAEPALALAGGADGMDIVRRILADAPRFMSAHAVLVLEIGNEYAHFCAAFPRLEAVWLDTSAGDDQVCLLTREALAI